MTHTLEIGQTQTSVVPNSATEALSLGNTFLDTTLDPQASFQETLRAATKIARVVIAARDEITALLALPGKEQVPEAEALRKISEELSILFAQIVEKLIEEIRIELKSLRISSVTEFPDLSLKRQDYYQIYAPLQEGLARLDLYRPLINREGYIAHEITFLFQELGFKAVQFSNPADPNGGGIPGVDDLGSTESFAPIRQEPAPVHLRLIS